jgi:hypothetical protein
LFTVAFPTATPSPVVIGQSITVNATVEINTVVDGWVSDIVPAQYTIQGSWTGSTTLTGWSSTSGAISGTLTAPSTPGNYSITVTANSDAKYLGVIGYFAGGALANSQTIPIQVVSTFQGGISFEFGNGTNSVSAVAGEPSSITFTGQLDNNNGSPLGGAGVVVDMLDPSGSPVSSFTAGFNNNGDTNSSGVYSGLITGYPTTAGTYTMAAYSAIGSTTVWAYGTFTVLPGPAKTLTLVANPTTIPYGGSSSISGLATDAYGNAIGSAPVTLSFSGTSGGSFTPTTVTTLADGTYSATFTPNKVTTGSQGTLSASAPGNMGISFSATPVTLTVDAPTSITAIGTIAGTPQVGDTLTAGTITPSGATVSYQWIESGTQDGTYQSISGATSSTYIPVSSNKGQYIEVVATGTGSYSGTVSSAPVGPVAAATATTTSITAIGTIAGTPQVGDTLTAGTITPSGATVSYQWIESGTQSGGYSDISGATSSAYTTVTSDQGQYIEVVATGTSSYSGTVTSASVGPVAAATTPVNSNGALTVQLNPGWNTLSTPFVLANPSVASVVYGANNVTAVMAYQNGQWVQVTSDNQTQYLTPMTGLYVDVAGNNSVVANFNPSTTPSPPPIYSLNQGWNLVGPSAGGKPGTNPQLPYSTFVAGTGSSVVMLADPNNGNAVANPITDTNDSVSNGSADWLYAAQPATIVGQCANN